jgi:hypothetical protein
MLSILSGGQGFPSSPGHPFARKTTCNSSSFPHRHHPTSKLGRFQSGKTGKTDRRQRIKGQAIFVKGTKDRQFLAKVQKDRHFDKLASQWGLGKVA